MNKKDQLLIIDPKLLNHNDDDSLSTNSSNNHNEDLTPSPRTLSIDKRTNPLSITINE